MIHGLDCGDCKKADGQSLALIWLTTSFGTRLYRGIGTRRGVTWEISTVGTIAKGSNASLRLYFAKERCR